MRLTLTGRMVWTYINLASRSGKQPWIRRRGICCGTASQLPNLCVGCQSVMQHGRAEPALVVTTKRLACASGLFLIITALSGVFGQATLPPNAKFLSAPFQSGHPFSLQGLADDLGLDPAKESCTCKNGEKCRSETKTYPDGLVFSDIGFPDEGKEPYSSLEVYSYQGQIIKAKLVVYCETMKCPGYVDSSIYFSPAGLLAFKAGWRKYLEVLSKDHPYLPCLTVGFKNRDDFMCLYGGTSSFVGPFGYSCGIAGIDPNGRSSIMRLFDQKEYTAIRYILFAENLISEVYAAEVLLQLQREGMVLTPAERKKLASLQSDTRTISVCQGCEYYENATVADAFKLMTSYPIRTLLDKYKRHRHLHSPTWLDYGRP